MATALITAADHPSGLGTARALAEVDVRLIGLCRNPASRLCRSRVWRRLLAVAGDIEAGLEKLVEIGRGSQRKVTKFPKMAPIDCSSKLRNFQFQVLKPAA